MDTFSACHSINDLLNIGADDEARNELIKLLDGMRKAGLPYTPLINALIRQVGLFPYLDELTASWSERFVSEAFRTDVGGGQSCTLHREQSKLLGALLGGASIAVSAPTSFGKSFVIDAFIAIKKPANVVIIVPTIALADETRRRLQRKFGEEYRIVTTSDASVLDRNIYIFPQERALTYIDSITSIDILVVDEFYKASKVFDKERAPSLIRAIIELGRKSSQRYFLAPNVSDLSESPFTRGMDFMRLDFNTVFLEKYELYRQIGKDDKKKGDVLLNILKQNRGKTLIYAGTYTNIDRISNLLLSATTAANKKLLSEFSSWLCKHYDPNWSLTQLSLRGVGVHNGRLHRSLSQIQVKLFEEEAGGLTRLISTSSIIEGVNTSAENVVLWSNKNGNAKITDFTYKNIIGRGGRMFKHFVGKIFVLEQPPIEQKTQLELTYPDELLGALDADEFGIDLSADQLRKLHANEVELQQLIGSGVAETFRADRSLLSSDSSFVIDIVRAISRNKGYWSGLGYLNSEIPAQWDSLLYKLINLRPGYWETKSRTLVEFVKVLSGNWCKTIPDLLADLDEYDVGIEQFFLLERTTTFKLATVLSDFERIYNRIFPNDGINLSLAIARLSNAFLPPIVYLLEEYGLPRMISRKIHDAGVIDLERHDVDISEVINEFRKLNQRTITESVGSLDNFDLYVLTYFFEGISSGQCLSGAVGGTQTV